MVWLLVALCAAQVDAGVEPPTPMRALVNATVESEYVEELLDDGGMAVFSCPVEWSAALGRWGSVGGSGELRVVG